MYLSDFPSNTGNATASVKKSAISGIVLCLLEWLRRRTSSNLSMANVSAFALLPDIKTRKPRLPILVDDLDDPPSLADPSPEARSNFGFVSTDFQQLIDRVVEQHIYEMSKCKGQDNGDVEINRARDTSKKSTRSRTVSDTSQQSTLSGQSEDPRKSRQSGVSVSDILREKHKEMREIQASEILDAWGDSITNSTTFRETSMLSAFKSREHLSEISIPTEEYAKMTRLEKLRSWLESPSYEALNPGGEPVNPQKNVSS